MKNLTLVVCVLMACTTSFAQVNLNSGLVAYYPFDGNFNDSSGNNNNGQPQNGVSFTADQWGNSNYAAYFDGIDDWIKVEGSAQLTPSTEMSLTFRIQAAAEHQQALISKNTWAGTNTTNNVQYHIGFNAFPTHNVPGVFWGSKHNNSCVSTTFYSDHYNFTNDSVEAGPWYCIVATFDNGVKKIFVDGILKSIDTVGNNLSHPTELPPCTSGDLNIGTWWQNDPLFYNGKFDELRIYGRALNIVEIDSVCNLTKTIREPTAIANFDNFSEIRVYPNPATDRIYISGINNVATINIHNQIGQVVYKGEASSASGINISELPAGVYVIQINRQGEVYTEKLIKK